DPALRSELLATRLRVGKIFNELGRGPEAKAAYEAAFDGYEAASRDRPGDLELRAGLAEAASRLGSYWRAIEIREELLRVRPGDAWFKKALAESCNAFACDPI